MANGGSPDLQQVRREFPQFAILQETTPGRSRYVARSRDLCRNPYAVIAANLAELRDALAGIPQTGKHDPPITGANDTATSAATEPVRALPRQLGSVRLEQGA